METMKFLTILIVNIIFYIQISICILLATWFTLPSGLSHYTDDPYSRNETNLETILLRTYHIDDFSIERAIMILLAFITFFSCILLVAFNLMIKEKWKQ